MIEILIAIVLMGTVVATMLSTLAVTIKASATERDHANAHAWLQTASDVLYGVDTTDCGTIAATTQTNVFNEYNALVKTTTSPEGWPSSQIEVVAPVLYWNGDIYQSVCYQEKGINLQLVTIRVTDPDGRIVESVEVVKG